MLLDLDGHVKLADFGLSKDCFAAGSLASSFCGSPEYMSPEMLARSGHNKAVDYYSLGALLYEMLTGLPPHYSRDRELMYERILNEPVIYPKSISPAAVSLLEGLLNKSTSNRLGARGGAAEIKAHSFFSGFDWAALSARKLASPNPLSVRECHFDQEFLASPVSWSEDDSLNAAAAGEQRLHSLSSSESTFRDHRDTVCCQQQNGGEEITSEYIRSVLRVTKAERNEEEDSRLEKRMQEIQQLLEAARSSDSKLFPGYMYNFNAQPESEPPTKTWTQPCTGSQKLTLLSGDCGGEPRDSDSDLSSVRNRGSSSSVRREGESTGASQKDTEVRFELVVADAKTKLGDEAKLKPGNHTRCSSTLQEKKTDAICRSSKFGTKPTGIAGKRLSTSARPEEWTKRGRPGKHESDPIGKKSKTLRRSVVSTPKHSATKGITKSQGTDNSPFSTKPKPQLGKYSDFLQVLLKHTEKQSPGRKSCRVDSPSGNKHRPPKKAASHHTCQLSLNWAHVCVFPHNTRNRVD